MKEKIVENIVKKYFDEMKEISWLTKLQGTGKTKDGRPDFIGCYNGRFIGIETKAWSAHVLDPRQLYAGMEIARAGGIYVVAYADFDSIDFGLSQGQSLDYQSLLGSSKSFATMTKDSQKTLMSIRENINKTKQTTFFY